MQPLHLGPDNGMHSRHVRRTGVLAGANGPYRLISYDIALAVFGQ